jgi:prolyl oligopeptidase
MKTFMKLFLTNYLILFPIFCYSQEKQINQFLYPIIYGEIKHEIKFGVKVTDDFYNLNDIENKKVQEWFKLQDSVAEAYFDTNESMQKYLDRFKELQNSVQTRVSMIRVNEAGNYFYLKKDDSLGMEKLFYKQKLDAEEKELFDPNQYASGEKGISYLKPSFDGKKIAIGFNENNEFSSKIKIYDLEASKFLNDEITNINPDFGGIEWLPDNSGFIYLYFPEVDTSKPDFKKKSFSVLHKIGENSVNVTPIFGSNANLKISADFYPKVKIGSSEDKYIIGYVASSDDYYESFIAEMSDVINGKPNWKPFFKKDDKIYYDQGELRGEEFIFRQGKLKGNSLAKINILSPDFNNPIILAEGTKDDPITNFGLTKDHIFFTRSLYGANVSLFKISSGNQFTQLDLPFMPGYISFFGESPSHNKIGIGMDGWTSDYTRYIIDENSNFQKEPLSNEGEYLDFANIISEQIMVSSHDGIEVPMSLVYKKGIKKNSDNEVFIFVYGAYGESLSPFFSPIFLDWAAQGGILAFPHVRGGGEKGKEWHEQGMKNLKYNSWKDLLACTEALIDMNLTKKGLISLYTSSAGGVTAAMAVNERPDLYSSFIAEVPRLNPFGLESSSNASSTSYLEYGTVKDSVEYVGLTKMDPYLNIKPDTTYPATLIMPSYNDDRIPLWDNGKYIAKLQKFNTANTPILMDIDYDSGHETFGDYNETIRLYSKIFSFAKSNMKN